MSQRVLVELQEDADVEGVRRRLEDLGNARVGLPRPELPGVSVVELDDDVDARLWVARANGVDGVRHAEPDALRWDLGPSVDDLGPSA